jgi:alginate O-acetyltransferase complex protein AlgI
VSFVSWPFAVLFAIVFAARLTIGRRKTEPAYIWTLIAAGAVFYAWHVPAYLLILVTSTSVDYLAGLMLGRLPAGDRRRRLVLGLSLATNVGLLAFFKYGDFALRSAADLLGLAGVTVAPPVVNVVLPIGISFYTFEAMSYTIDVYRGAIAPVRSYAKFFLFISFFPHLVAGPIVRAWEFLPQLPRPRRLRAVAVYEGLWLVVTGYFLKTVCADNLGAYVNDHWQAGYDPATDASTALWLALMFSGQIFADFAGYSNIARGLAYLLGFRLPLNFDAPYLAATFRGFWERWHITLSRWLRDYLYVPLGGNRGSRLRTCRNLIVVMLLGGLWHGAAYTFIAWGAIHGVALAVERAAGLHRGRRHLAIGVAWGVVVQVTVLAAWVCFRSDTLGHAGQFLANIARLDFTAPPAWALNGLLFLLPVAGLHGWSWMAERERLRIVPAPVFAAAAALLVWVTVILHGRSSAFIYFQF